VGVGGDVRVDCETFLATDFVNFKINLAQSFEYDYIGRVCVCMFIGISNHTYINICICTV
jgi:hypothetical protein